MVSCKLDYRWIVFAITFISYATTHACRQSFASAKNLLKDDWSFTKHFEGAMDGVFLFSYALGLFTSGVMGDKFDTAKFHSLGLFMTSFIYVIFGSSIPYFELNVNDYQTYYLVLWIINGFIQSIGWPTGVKLIGNWFTYSASLSSSSSSAPSFTLCGYGVNNIGAVFGIWASHQYIGNIIGIGYVSLINYYNLDIQWIFYIPSIQAFIVAFCVLLFVPTYPKNYQPYLGAQSMLSTAADNTSILTDDNLNSKLLLDPDEQQNNDIHLDPKNNDQIQHKTDKNKADYEWGVDTDSSDSVPSIEYRISFRKALRLPNVLRYGLFFACLKGVNYTIFFWFGYFGDTWDHFSTETSGNFLILFNVGSIFGGWICGLITDQYKLWKKRGRSTVILLFLIISIPSVFCLAFKLQHLLILYGFLCFCAGFFVGGPSNLISTVMATDIGKLEEIKGNPASFSTVSGIIDGMGSFGAASADYAASWISDYKHYYVYLLLSILLFLAALIILPVVINDLKGTNKPNTELDGDNDNNIIQ